MSRYQLLTVTTVIGALLLVAAGSAVRTTGSGLGCPDWPLCYGQVIPPADREAIYEWGHRTVAAFVGLLIIAQAAWTLVAYRADRVQAALAIATLPLLGMLADLGRRVVLEELPSRTVALHMLLSLALVSTLALMVAYAFLGPRRRLMESRECRKFRRVAILTASAVALVMVVGAYTVATHAGFACLGWPDCPQARIPLLDGARLHHIHWLHRLTVLGGLLAVFALWHQVRGMSEARPMLSTAATALLFLYAGQIFVGAGNIWSDFSTPVRVTHLALAAMIAGLAVAIAAAGPFESRDAPATGEEPAGRSSRQRATA